MSGRDQVLAKVRAALRTAERAAGEEQRHDPPAPARRERPPVDRTELAERFAERVADYRATVVRVGPDGVAGAIADALADLRPQDPNEAEDGVHGGPEDDARGASMGSAAVAVPAGLPVAWYPQGALDGSALSTADLRGVEAVVTACRVAVAETGTIVLDHGPDQGPRRLTLVPDRHVCVVRADQILDDLDDAFVALRPTAAAAGSSAPDDAGGPSRPAPPLTFISGPSATSDIELQRVEGVHGPRTLIVILVDHETAPPDD